MEYIVKKTNIINPSIDSPEWDKAEEGVLTQTDWDGYCSCPATTFKMLCSNEGISVLMHTDEIHLRAEAKVYTDPVYEDSCMEFFFKPDYDDVRYINFEVNPTGVMHIGIGSGKHDRNLIAGDRTILDIVSDAKEGDWTVKFYLPYKFLLNIFEKVAPVCRGNFYKCGKKTDHSHSGAWSMVESDTPNFHIPDFFGVIRFEK